MGVATFQWVAGISMGGLREVTPPRPGGAVLRASRPQKAVARASRLSAEHLNGGQDAPQTTGKMPAVRPVMDTLPPPGSREGPACKAPTYP